MDAKWVTLGRELRQEIFLRSDRIRARLLCSVWQTGNAEIIELNGLIVAFGALWPIDEHDAWFELGSLWVVPEFRGKGLMSSIFAKLACRIPEHGHFFLLTREPKIAHLAGKHKMREETDVAAWFASPPWDSDGDPRTLQEGSQLFVL